MGLYTIATSNMIKPAPCEPTDGILTAAWPYLQVLNVSLSGG